MLSKNWRDALAFTRAQGIDVPPLPPEKWALKSYAANGELRDGLLQALHQEYSGKRLNEFVLKCFNVHDFIYNALYDRFNVPCYLTIGWAECNGTEFFKHSADELTTWFRTGIPDRDDVRLHCWITFPSGEMLDATLPSVIALRADRADDTGEIRWLQSENHPPFTYHPTCIGMGSLRALRLAH